MFVECFARIAKPLYDLLKKEMLYVWSIDCKEAFEQLCKRLCEAPVLLSPSEGKEYWFYTDASNYVLGGTLAQIEDDLREHQCGIARES